MKNIKTLDEYCQAIQIPPPKYPHFDVRTFEENMKTVVAQMAPFRHEFYAIAFKKGGTGHAKIGVSQTAESGYTIFFNSPYQILSWDIAPDWEGYYIIFTQNFVNKSTLFKELLLNFPFLRMDHSIPFAVSQEDMQTILQIFTSIYQEYHSAWTDRMNLIQAHTLVLLNYVKRYYNQSDLQGLSQENRNQDLQLVSRYQAMIELNLAQTENFDPGFHPQSTTFYADQLSIHPNHLNTVVKRTTGQTALKLLHKKLYEYSQSFLLQTDLSIKEVAYALHFREPAHFNNFFKKYAKKTPQQFRD
ncbi:MAG: helix-turn-helix transcriptional regulator, partial [Bacteroidota bacterium]